MVAQIILIVLGIIILIKPDIFTSKKIREKATPEQLERLDLHTKKSLVYVISIVIIADLSSIINPWIDSVLLQFAEIILMIILLIGEFKYGWPSSKERKKILKEIETNNSTNGDSQN